MNHDPRIQKRNTTFEAAITALVNHIIEQEGLDEPETPAERITIREHYYLRDFYKTFLHFQDPE